MSERFSSLWLALGLKGVSAGVYDELTKLYGSSDRFYHNLGHVANCLALLDEYRELALDPLIIEAALWFHDAVYDTRGKDNEEKSALLARDCFNRAGGMSDDTIGRVENLILATSHQGNCTDTDAKLIVDIDLAILGSDPESYRRYANAIRMEYGWVTNVDYREGRTKVLKSFLDRGRIFQTAKIHETLELKAVQNLRDEILRLSN